ncbi:MAG: 30S ribosomal protein S3 [Sedimentisphaerales bacterium]|jgi:small subunit ribosomal protein S3|nr:30S ribosomal protein S3 [Planctomycetota bacterium]MDY0357451.1 30S ribosomal protein S3 [Sedimentisphaerales bacterium]NLT76047.1 30S ribosomal protein S3 [Planctomycetota bacterium]
MGQKTSPIGFRTGVTLGWQSTWFAPKASYGDCLVEDQKIRDFVDRRYNQRMPKGAVARVEIVRTRNEVNVTMHSGRPGVVIGPRGGEVDKVREELEGFIGRKVTVNVVEIKEPDLNAALVAQGIAEQLGKRASFRRTMKQYCEGAMNAGARGVKIMCSGRLAGSEMARTETQKMGSIPLHTLDADVDYALGTARTTYGAIGIKVWIYKGKFGEEREVVRRRPPRRRPMRSGGGPRSEGPRNEAAESGSDGGAEAGAAPKE